MWSGHRSFAPLESSLVGVVEEGPCIQRHMSLACRETDEFSVYAYLFYCVIPALRKEDRKICLKASWC